MADTKLRLGDFEFSEFEIPERIPLGGAQALVVHKLPGGARVIQAMGRDDDPIQWAGLFRGETALARARRLDAMRVQGLQLELTFFDFRFKVVIRAFRYTVERFYRVPYTLELEVVSQSTASTPSPAASLTTLVKADSASALALGAKVADGPLSAALASMDKAISQVSDFAKAAQTTINSVLAPVSAVQQRVGSLIASVGNTVTNVATLGGVLPNNPVAKNALKLLGQANAAAQLPILYNLQAVAGRIQTNLNLVSGPSGARTMTVGGGTLFDAAAKAYGDPLLWSALAKANGTVDPALTSIQTLVIPNNPQNTGGVYEK